MEERERIAMNLHDGVMQSLYALALGLEARARLVDSDPAQAREALRQAIRQINGMIPEIRAYISDLRPRELGAQGLRAGIEALAEEIRACTLVRPEIDLPPETEDRLGPDVVVHALYIAREATSNVVRHSGASAVAIRLAVADGHLMLTICDNGRGFDTERTGRRAGDGLRNMAERAQMIGGRLAVTSQPGGGSEVRLELPWPEARD